MRKFLITSAILTALLSLASCGEAEPSENVTPTLEVRIPAEEYISPASVEVGADGTVYSADETGGRVIMVKPDGTTSSVILEGGAREVKLHDGKLYVLSGGAAGKVTVYPEGLGKAEAEYSVGHTPTDIEFIGDRIFVTNRFDNSVTELSSDGAVAREIFVGREPMAAAVANGKLFVACHLPDDAATADKVSSGVYVIDPASGEAKEIELVNGSGGVKDIEADPSGERLYVTTVIARYQYPTTQLDGAWINSNGFAVIDAKDEKYVTTVLLDDVTLGAASPWGIAFDDENIYFAISGTGEIMSMSLQKLGGVINSYKGEEMADSIGALHDIATRTQLSGQGVRDIVSVGGKLYCAQYFSGNIAVLDENLNETVVALGEQPENDIVRTGEILWYDATKCYQSWEACASCHPDARADGFNWDNLNDGLGNPKSAVSMMYTHRTSPVMTTGIRADAETAVRAGMKFIQFNTLDEESNRAIDEFLKSLQPTPSPMLNLDGTLSETAAEGEKLFDSYGCVECHPAPLYTDNAFHTSPALGNDGGWENREFATPTLVEAWRSGPYLYNGSANSLEEAVKPFMPDAPEEDIKAVTAFVYSIGDEGEPYGVEQVFSADGNGKVTQGRPYAGNTITSITVRCQDKDAPAAKVKITAYGKIYEYELGDMQHNTAVKVDLSAENIVMKEDAKILISFENSKGEVITSGYLLTARES